MNKFIALEPCAVATKTWYDYEDKEVLDDNGDPVIDPVTNAPMTGRVITDWTPELLWENGPVNCDKNGVYN